MGSGKCSAARNYIVCTVHLIYRMVKFRRLSWAWYVTRMEEGRSAFSILTGKPTEKRSLGRPGHRLEDNARIMLKK